MTPKDQEEQEIEGGVNAGYQALADAHKQRQTRLEQIATALTNETEARKMISQMGRHMVGDVETSMEEETLLDLLVWSISGKKFTVEEARRLAEFFM